MSRVSTVRSVARSLVSELRFGQFLVVGMLIDNAVLALLVDGLGTSVVIAALCSKEISISTMFVLNERWTFADEQEANSRHLLYRFLKSNAVRAIGAGVGIVVLSVLNYWFGVWYLLANVIGIGVGFVFNYVFESTVTWQVHRE